MIFFSVFIHEGDCAAADSPIFKSEESFEEMSSAKHFFLKLTERNRPTVKLTAPSRGQLPFKEAIREYVFESRTFSAGSNW